MEPALRNFQLLIGRLPGDAVNQTIFERNPPRPPALQVTLQRLGLAGSLKRGACIL
jgi:hypothetical protein